MGGSICEIVFAQNRFIFFLPSLVTSNEARMLGEEVTYEVGVPRARGSLGAPAAI